MCLYRACVRACEHQSSLLQLIVAELGKNGIASTRTRQHRCLRLIMRFEACSVLLALLQRRKTHPEQDRKRCDEEDPRIDSAAGTTTTEPKLTCIFASFDAWLFADSDVLWAVLISEIFKQARASLGVGVDSCVCSGVLDVRATETRRVEPGDGGLMVRAQIFKA